MIQTISKLKSWFKKGMYPTESQFADVFDSFVHKSDQIPTANIDPTLLTTIDNKVSMEVFNEFIENGGDPEITEAEIDALFEEEPVQDEQPAQE